MTGMTTDWDFYELFIPQILRGFGLMMCMVPINNIALGTMPPARMRGASGLFNLTRNLGGAVGLAVINTGAGRTGRTCTISGCREGLDWGNPMRARVDEEHGVESRCLLAWMAAAVAIKQMVGLGNASRRWCMSFSDVFLLLTVLFLAMIVGIVLIDKPAPQGGGGVAAATDFP